jgi:hypothetical protein
LRGWAQRQSGRQSGGTRGSGFVDGAPDVGGFLFVTGVEDAAELVVAREEGVGFVDEEGRTDLFDDAEEGCRADVGGGDGVVCQVVENREQSCFAAAFVKGFDAEVGGGVAEVEGVCMKDPEGEGGVRWEDDEAADER